MDNVNALDLTFRAVLRDYATGDYIRAATAAEAAESDAAGDTGAILVDGLACYVTTH